MLLGLSRARPQEPKKLGNAKTRSPPTQANHDMSRICENKDSANRGDPNNRWPRSARLTKVGRRCRACGAFRRPPLAVRRACLRRRAFYASPCQATAPSLERFTHHAHSAGPLRPEVELTRFFKTILGSKMEAKIKSKTLHAKIVPGRLPRRSWSRVAAGSHFGLHFGSFFDLWNP